jgi:transposase
MKKPEKINLKPQEMEELLGRVRAALGAEDYRRIKSLVEGFLWLRQSVEKKKTSIKRLAEMLFGSSTEKTAKILGKQTSPNTSSDGKQRRGHGRNSAAAYSGARKVIIEHPDLETGDGCTACGRGHVYSLKPPRRLVRIEGRPPLEATVYELEKLRCNLCGKIYTAEAPKGVGSKKYNETAGSMIALLKYGSGVPFYRMETLQQSLGIPLPASTQWEVVEQVADRIYPAFEELKRQASRGEVIHNDDTAMKILGLEKSDLHRADNPSRKGTFTSGIVSVTGDRRIALFFTGTNHAGENLAKVLKSRSSGSDPPIQMCDALSRNRTREFESVLANCLAHGRRRFVDVASSFPDECRFVLETLAAVYHHDAVARQQNLTPDERLEFHQAKSGPLMQELHRWMMAQMDEKKVEPNSSLGEAVSYMLNHWEPLTLFLRVPKAPLDNNLCERALKRAILHRKNALFFKTRHGANVGDLFMSLIHTCCLQGWNPFDYLTALQIHHPMVSIDPQNWMPWNYQDNLDSTE